MRSFARPIIAVSACLEFEACRYNALSVACPLVRDLMPFVDYRPACPEKAIGLGVPRDPIRLVRDDEGVALYQPATGRDVTALMDDFTQRHLATLRDADGFILKGRSPSCGIKDVKVYPDRDPAKTPITGKAAGLYGGAVIAAFPGRAIEDEGRLENFTIREHFLTRIFALAEFRGVYASGSMARLVQFQADNKLLLMAYNQTEMRALGRITANPVGRPWRETIDEYETHLRAALSRVPRFQSNINVLQHAMGYFSEGMSASEKRFLLGEFETYRAGKIPLSAVTGIIRALIARFGSDYLSRQTYFAPYPTELVSITDSGKGRGA